MRGNRQTVEEVFAAFSAGEIERAEEMLLAACADDVTVYEPANGPFGGIYQGRDAFRSLMARIHKVFDMSRVVLEHVVSDGDVVVARVLVTDALPSGSSQREAMACEWYQFRDGEIVELRPFAWVSPVHQVVQRTAGAISSMNSR